MLDPIDERTRSAGIAAEVCPSCDSPGSWTLSRRHRFNPFGGVTALVLTFWVALLGWALDFGFLPAAGLALFGALLLIARRTALVCQVCGFVKPRG